MRWVAALAVCLVVATSARADDWSVRRDAFDPRTIAAYKAVLARDPHDDNVLRQLRELYRRHRTIAALEAEYRTQLAAGESWAVLVVLARLPAGDAVALWKRAVAVKPDDTRAWIALGDAARSEPAAAATAYRHAADVARGPRDKRAALTKLVGAAVDAPMIDAAYIELIALAPKDGMLWLDRGNAQLAAKQHAAARTSYATAETLLAGDPERRLSAMTSQGIALERLGQPDEAIAQYERTLGRMPAGYFLAQELVLRIVEVERKRHRLAAAITWIETRWPERSRGHFEWALLGDLLVETTHEDRAIEAYRHAVARAAFEVATQRKLIALLDKLQPNEALAQHVAAARIAPGDAPLQLALAKRYFPAELPKAFATLDALARRFASDVGVHSSIAELYEEWAEPLRAIGEYEAIARLEPNDPEHAIVLGDALWRVHQNAKAIAAWARLDKIATADALHRHGEVLAVHSVWDAAAEAYTKALARDATRKDTLVGRARAYEALDQFPEAIADAGRAVALGGVARLDEGRRSRSLLVRILDKKSLNTGTAGLPEAVARWRFAFDRGDVTAGYLLAAHHERIASQQRHVVLLELYRRVPNDDSLGLEVARSFVRRNELAQARAELERIARRSPALAQEIASTIAYVEEMRARMDRDIREAEAGRDRSNRDLFGARRRTGIRIELGSDVANASGAIGGIGIYRAHRVSRGTSWAWRFDWLQRDDDHAENQILAVGAGLARRVVDARRFELAAGIGPRAELRFGDNIPSATLGRVALGGDVTLELLPRALPAVLGVRWQQSLTDAARSSALVVELGFELR
ncbi:MAG: hypothetical protein ABI867_00630 [Kofleriaceae bacterium]